MKIRGETPAQRAATVSFAVISAAAAALLVGIEGSPGNSDELPRRYSVHSFTYDSARNIGKITAAETFRRAVTPAEASDAMETTLEASSYDIATHFPTIPEDVRAGDMSCHVLDSSKQDRHFSLYCVVTPLSDRVNG